MEQAQLAAFGQERSPKKSARESLHALKAAAQTDPPNYRCRKQEGFGNVDVRSLSQDATPCLPEHLANFAERGFDSLQGIAT